MLTLGLGGIYTAELFRDVSLRVPPVDRPMVEEMLGELRAARLLAGFRGAPPAGRWVHRHGPGGLAELEAIAIWPNWNRTGDRWQPGLHRRPMDLPALLTELENRYMSERLDRTLQEQNLSSTPPVSKEDIERYTLFLD